MSTLLLDNKKIVTSKYDVDSITIRDNQEPDLNRFLKSLTEHFTDIELKSFHFILNYPQNYHIILQFFLSFHVLR